MVCTLLQPASLLAPLYGSDRITPAIGGFYIRASNGSVTLPAAGYDYGVQLGNLHRWDLHPLE